MGPLPIAPLGQTPTSNELAVLNALSIASQAFTGTQRLEEVLDGLLGSVLLLAQADAGSIMLLTPNDEMLEVVAARGPRAEQIIGVSSPVEHSVSGWVLRQGRTVVLQGRAEPGKVADDSQPVSAYPRDLASSVVMPLRGRSRVLGVLSASRAPGTPAMQERTVHLLELLGSQAAILIDNARLAERETILEKKAAAELQATLTELKRQYQEVSLGRSRVQAVLDATSEAIALVTADNLTLSVNRRFAELFLASDQEIPEPYAYAAFLLTAEHVFEDAPSFLALLDETLATPELELRRTVVQMWPEHRELDLYSTPVRHPEGERLGRLFVFRDVSLERAADRVKTEFVSMISHELRTPLTSINGYVDLLLDDEFGKLKTDQWNSLQIVRRNGDHLLALINDLLDVTRMMSGTIRLKPVSVDLAEIIQAAIEILSPQIAARHQALTVDVPTGLEPLRGDPLRLRQVFVNLLSNAHKYTPEGGQLRLSVHDEGSSIRIDVQDWGVGMSPAEMAKLFTKFFRADNPATRGVGGTGLGLVITRELVEMHGGTIEVSSQPGEGSTFSVTLPRLQAAVLDDAASPAELAAYTDAPAPVERHGKAA